MDVDSMDMNDDPCIVHRPAGAKGAPANERLLNHGECLGQMFDFCTMREVVCFAMTSKEIRWRVNNYILWRYCILLRRWFSKPDKFMNILHHTSSVISGSTALAFLLGASWVTGDLDVYVPRGEISLLIRGYLTKEEGYTIETRQSPASKTEDYDHHPMGHTDMKGVYKLSKRVTDETGQPTTLSIDIIELRTDEAIAPIFRFHSSTVMNWISGRSFGMAYPNLTCDGVAIVNQMQYSRAANVGKWRAKYSERGFKFYDSPAEMDRQKPCGGACPLVRRSTDDVGMLLYDFSGDGSAQKGQSLVKWSLYDRSSRAMVPIRCLNPHSSRSLTVLKKR